MKLSFEPVTLPLEHPFSITGYTFLNLEAVWVTLEDSGVQGRGEGVGVYYLGDNQKLMLEELASAKTEVEAGADPFEVASRLASKGGAGMSLSVMSRVIRSTASAAWAGLSANTATSGSPTLAMRSRASMGKGKGASISSTGARSGDGLGGRSAPVNTATTTGAARASAMSMPAIRPVATGLRKKARCRGRASAISAV